MSLKPRRVDLGATWQLLVETVQGVITCGSVARAVWNDRFSDVYALCVAYPEPLGEKLYGQTKTFLEDHVTKLHQEVSLGGDEKLLTRYHHHWLEYSRGSRYLNQLYGYLNSHFIRKQQHSDADINYGGFGVELQEQLLEIGALALDIWRKVMIDPLKENLVYLLLDQVHSDRLGGTVNQGTLHGIINSFVEVEEFNKKSPLKLYEDLFEGRYLKELGDYYRQEANRLLGSYDCSQYMEKVIHRLDDENLRSRKFLHPSSYSKVTRECEQRMISMHIRFLHDQCRDMVQKEQKLDLRHMYQLLSPVPSGLSVMIHETQQHIQQIGLRAISSLKGDSVPSQFVESMLEVHVKYTELIQEVFGGDQQFVGALDKACAAVINHRTNPKANCKSPEYLARYCDTLLKKSTKGVSETEVDDKLAQSITVFKYLDDKDIYQRIYARMLARRLIFGQSQSMDAEEAMINRLKQACGYEFTNKLHRMFTDMTISQDLDAKFSDYIKNDNTDLGVNFSILVLQAGAWPIGQTNLPSFTVPQELEKSVRMFELFYKKSFSGRKLTWLHYFCNTEMKLTYLKKPYFVTMGMYHMGVMLAFNNAPRQTFRDLSELTQLPEKELVKQLQSLLDSKLLAVEGSLGSNSVLKLNLEYTNKRTKFKILAAAQKETPQDMEQTHSSVDEHRKMYLQAAIVRIMKARKVLKHNLLIQEVISQSRARFSPSVSMIKKCIESLIDKQYIERTAAADEYSYIA